MYPFTNELYYAFDCEVLNSEILKRVIYFLKSKTVHKTMFI